MIIDATFGLTVAFCRQHGAGVIIRGVRNRSDRCHEYQLAAMNEALGITTLLLPAQPQLVAMSSKDNFAADREAGDKTLQANPDLAVAARANRAFLGRAVRFLVAEAGIPAVP